MSVLKFRRSRSKIGVVELCQSMKGLLNSLGDTGDGIRSWGSEAKLLTTSCWFSSMSILANVGSACAVYTAPNGWDKITQWDNHIHPTARANGLSPYPSWYQVRPRTWSLLCNNLLIISQHRFCSGFSQISLFLEMNLWTLQLATSSGTMTPFKSSIMMMPCGP